MSLNPTQLEVLQKNHIYDSTASPIWKFIYDCVHAGREFANIGGKEVLDEIACHAQLGRQSRVVEFCSGSGATVEYMATTYGCHMTGLELNAHQCGLAKKRVTANPSCLSNVQFILGDLVEWVPDAEYDLGYALDSLILVSNLERALQNAYQALRPGGTLSFAEITSGPFIDDAARRYAWEEDGMLNLLSPPGYSRLLRNAGFTDINFRNLNMFAEQRAAAIHFAIRDHEEQLAVFVRDQTYEAWLQSTAMYWKGFTQGKYGYALITAIKS